MVNLASLPSPRTWSANDLVTVPRLRADAADAIAFLLSRPYFSGTNTSGRSWASGSDLALGLDTELADTWAGHLVTNVGSATNAQYWAPVSGWYLVRVAAAFQYISSTQAAFAGAMQGVTNGIAWGPVRGAVVLDGSTNNPVAQSIDLVQMSAAGSPGGSGDWVQFNAYQNTGGSINLQSAATQLPTASARWVCATSGTEPLPVPPLTPCPSPVTSAWLNANVRDAIRFLTYPPICRAYYVPGTVTLASQAFPGSAAPPINTAIVDNYGGLNTTTGLYTAPVAGRYLIAGQFNLASAAVSGAYACGITVNGGTVQWGDRVNKVSDSTGGGAGVVKRVRLNANDTVQLRASQNTGSTIAYNTGTEAQTRLVIVWEGI